MAKGFTSLDEQFAIPLERGLFEITEVRFVVGDDPQLCITMEGGGWLGRIVFDDPVSHRVQDERDLLSYWAARDSEGVAAGTAFQIAESAFLREMSGGVSAATAKLTHYLFAGCDICVDVIASEPPDVEMHRVG